MISEKNALDAESSGESKTLACWSHSAAWRMSASFMPPFDELYRKWWQCGGWNSAAVMTSDSSSMLAGLMSTILKLRSETSKFHRLIRRSSAEMNVSRSQFSEIEL